MAVNGENATRTLKKIANLKSSGKKITLISGKDGQKIQIDQVILASITDFFSTIFLENVLGHNEIVLPQVDADFLKQIAAFTYTDTFGREHGCNVDDLLDNNNKSIEKLEVKDSRKRGQEAADPIATALVDDLSLSKRQKCFEEKLTSHNCVEWFILAGNMDSFRGLREKAFRLICKEFGSVASTQLNRLSLEDFKEVISADKIPATETLIFERLVEWVEYDKSARAKHVMELLNCIRLEHIPDRVLIQKVDVFCEKYGANGFTKHELCDRLMTPHLISEYRLQWCQFQINGRGVLNIRSYSSVSKNWITTCTFPVHTQKSQYGAAFGQDKLFIIGGLTGGKNSEYSKSVEAFDLVTRTWENSPDMHSARVRFNPIIVDQFIYVFGGFNGAPMRDCERLDTILNKWHALKPMNVANYNQATATLHGYIFVAGGSFNQTSVERYDPVKDEWMKMASLQYSRQDLDLVEYLGSLYAYEGGLDWATIPRERYNFDRDTWSCKRVANTSVKVDAPSHRMPDDQMVTQRRMTTLSSNFLKNYIQCSKTSRF